MKEFIRKNMPEILFAAVIVTALVIALTGCGRLTKKQEDAIKTGAGGVGLIFGLPPWISETAAALALAASHYLTHKNGCRIGAKKAKALNG